MGQREEAVTPYTRPLTVTFWLEMAAAAFALFIFGAIAVAVGG
jgi:hypothetical protein